MKSFTLIGILFAVSHTILAAETWTPNEKESQTVPDLNDKATRLKRHQTVFEPLQNIGNVGRVLYEVTTNEQALGDEFSKISAIITKLVGFNDYRKLFNKGLLLSRSIRIPDRVRQLYDRVADIQDPKTGETMGDAITVITNIFNDSKVVDEIIQKIRNQSDPAVNIQNNQ